MFISKKRARSVSNAILLIGLAFVVFFNAWWPGILLAIGLSFALRNLLLAQWHDFFVNIIVFGGIFAYYHYDIPIKWAIYFIPVALVIAAIYILYREFFIGEQATEVEVEEELNKEMEEHETED